MIAVEMASAGTIGWFAVLFGERPAAPVRRWVARSADGDLTVTPQMAAALQGLALTEERARAATSGFEMGEYEPLARRN